MLQYTFSMCIRAACVQLVYITKFAAYKITGNMQTNVREQGMVRSNAISDKKGTVSCH